MSASSKKKLRKEIKEAKMTERQKQERAEAKKVKRLTFAFVAVIVLILGIFIGSRIADGITRYGLFEKNTIAATVGSHKLNSVTMNYFFRDAVDNAYNTAYQYYGEEASKYVGFDVSKPLNEQVKDQESGQTWADYFFELAMDNARAIYTMYDAAQAANFTLPEDAKATIANNLNNMQLTAGFSGFSSFDHYLREIYGNGSDAKNYEEYLTMQVTASAYYEYYQTTLNYDDAAIRAYDTEHPNEFSSYNFHSYYLNHTSFRTGGTTDDKGTTTYSAEETEAARKAAEAAANELVKATSVEELDAAIAALEINKDATTTPKSTANTDVLHSNLLADYAQWLGASDRKAGDIKAFPSKSTSTDADGNSTEVINGYYVLMFDSRVENETKMANIRQVLIACEGGTTDANNNTTYSTEEKAAAHTKAEDLLKKWKDEGATKEGFISMIKDVNKNETADDTIGLVENVNKQSSAVYKNWALDASRKAGDTTVIDTTNGTYIVYYEGDSELNYRDYMITQAKKSEDLTNWETSIIEAVEPVKGDTSKVKMWLVYIPSAE